MIYTLVQVGLQGVVSPAKLQANGGSALVYIAQTMGGSTLARLMALAIALSVIATTGTGIVLGARIMYGMASYRALPGFLAAVSRSIRYPGCGQRRRRRADRRSQRGLPAYHLSADCL